MSTDLTLIIDGVDILPYVLEGGIEWSRNDVDSSAAGEMQDGTVDRDRIIMRRKMTVSVGELLTADMKIVQQAIYPQWVSVTFLDPLEGEVITRTFYSNNVACTAGKKTKLKDGTNSVKWRKFSFPLIEKGVPGEGAST
jgi:hypothetical protein